MNKIKVDVTKLTEKQQDEFIIGFHSVLCLNDYHDQTIDTPWCAPWTYTDEILVPAFDKIDYFKIGRSYAFEVAFDVIDLITQDITTELEFNLENENFSHHVFLDAQIYASNYADFTLTDYAKQFIKAIFKYCDIQTIRIKNNKVSFIFSSGLSCNNINDFEAHIFKFLTILVNYAKEWQKFINQLNS